MLDALVHRQDRDVPGATEAAMTEQAVQIAEDAVVAVGHGKNPVNEIRPGNVQPVLRNFRAFEIEEIIRLVAE